MDIFFNLDKVNILFSKTNPKKKINVDMTSKMFLVLEGDGKINENLELSPEEKKNLLLCCSKGNIPGKTISACLTPREL